jgi:protein TonB
MRIQQKDLSALAPRTGLLLLIAAVHGALILWLAEHSMIRRAPEIVPIAIAALEPAPRSPDVIKLPSVALTQVTLRTIVPPEFIVPSDAPVAVTVASANTQQTASTAASSTPAAPTDLPSLSEVSYLQPPKPSYPREARLAHEEGLVVLRVLIDASGHAKEVEIVRSSGHPRLDQEARNAVARALFIPYSIGGVARAAIAMVPIEFSLHRG